MQINKTINASVNIVYYIACVSALDDLNVDMACVCARRMEKFIESEDFVGPVKKKKNAHVFISQTGIYRIFRNW